MVIGWKFLDCTLPNSPPPLNFHFHYGIPILMMPIPSYMHHLNRKMKNPHQPWGWLLCLQVGKVKQRMEGAHKGTCKTLCQRGKLRSQQGNSVTSTDEPVEHKWEVNTRALAILELKRRIEEGFLWRTGGCSMKGFSREKKKMSFSKFSGSYVVSTHVAKICCTSMNIFGCAFFS